MDWPFKPKYGTVSLVLLQLVVAAVYGIEFVKASSDQTTQCLCQHSQIWAKYKLLHPLPKIRHVKCQIAFAQLNAN